MLRGSISMRQTHPQETFLVCGCKVRGFALIVQYLKIVVLFIWLNESVRFLLSIIIIHATTNLYNRQYHFISWMSKKLLFFVLRSLNRTPASRMRRYSRSEKLKHNLVFRSLNRTPASQMRRYSRSEKLKYNLVFRSLNRTPASQMRRYSRSEKLKYNLVFRSLNRTFVF